MNFFNDFHSHVWNSVESDLDHHLHELGDDLVASLRKVEESGSLPDDGEGRKPPEDTDGHHDDRSQANFVIRDIRVKRAASLEAITTITGTVDAAASDIIYDYDPGKRILADEDLAAPINAVFYERDDGVDLPVVYGDCYLDENGDERWAITAFLPPRVFRRLRLAAWLAEGHGEAERWAVELYVLGIEPQRDDESEPGDFRGRVEIVEYGFRFYFG